MTHSWQRRLFRRAKPASPRWNLVKTGTQIAVFWSVLLLAIPLALVEVERAIAVPSFDFPVPLAWTILVVASALGLWSGATMAVDGEGTPLPLDAPRRLVVRGPYRYVRNPMAIAGLTQGACVSCLLGSWLSLAYVAAGFAVWNYIVRPLEERELDLEFGDAYRRYRDEVRCWIP